MKQFDEKTIIILSSAILLLILFFIQRKSIENGEVVEKKYQKAHSEFKMIPSSGGGGMRPQLVVHNDEWSVILKNDTDTGRCWVSELEWNKIEVGDWVNCRDLHSASNSE